MFQVGDKIKCVSNQFYELSLVVGVIYTVSKILNSGVYLEEVSMHVTPLNTGFDESRFVFAVQAGSPIVQPKALNAGDYVHFTDPNDPLYGTTGDYIVWIDHNFGVAYVEIPGLGGNQVFITRLGFGDWQHIAPLDPATAQLIYKGPAPIHISCPVPHSEEPPVFLPKCECGVDSIGGGNHSTWCPKHGTP